MILFATQFLNTYVDISYKLVYYLDRSYLAKTDTSIIIEVVQLNVKNR